MACRLTSITHLGTELEMTLWLLGSSRGLLGYILATCPCRLRQAGLSCQLVSFRKEDLS